MPFVTFDPKHQDAKVLETLPSGMEFTQRAKELIDGMLVERGIVFDPKKRGKLPPVYIPVVKRSDGEVRWFNIGDRVSNRIYGEALLGPHWRLATKEEEAAEKERCEKSKKAQAKKMFRYNQEAAAALASQAQFQRLSDIAGEIPDGDEEEVVDAAPKDDKGKKAK